MQTPQAQSMSPKWHVSQWGFWGWLETAFKLGAVVAGLLAAVGAQAILPAATLGHLPGLILLGLTAVLSLGLVFVRFGQRETISFAFALANLVGHIAVLYALIRAPQAVAWPVAFGVLWVIGQLIKLQFLRITGFVEPGRTTREMLTVTIVLTVLYGLMTALFLV